jgi:type I restriction enzyme, S subunit
MIVNCNWPVAKIEDIAEKVAMGPFGSSIKVETFVNSGIPVISGQHLHGSKVNDNVEFNFITEEHADRLKNANVKRGDIIFTHAGNIGQVAYVPEDSKFERYVISQRQFYMRCDRLNVIPEYVVAYFNTPEGKHRLLANTSSVGVPSIAQPVTYLRTIEIPVPPLPDQRAIAHILGTLDDKIELNRKMNETLEAMARALFKSWFVDFDPVSSKAEGRPTGLPKHIADLFPDSFEDSELGEIPKGWEVRKLGNLLELTYGKALKAKDRQKGSVPVYGSNGQVGWHDERLVAGPGIIVGRKGNPGIITWTPIDFFAIDTTFYVIPKENCQSLHFLFHVLLNQNLASLGADSAVPGLNRNLAYMSNQVLPPPILLEIFERLANGFSHRMHNMNEETRTLAALRDTLLPKLISGEMRMKFPEHVIGRIQI